MVPGVSRAVEIEPSPPPAGFNPLGGVAVIGRNTWAAIKGRQALKIEWNDRPNVGHDSTAFKATLEASARRPGRAGCKKGDVDAAEGKAAPRQQAQYYLPPLRPPPSQPPAAA